MNHTFHRRDMNTQQSRSPRQIAKKAYNTANKKINLDNRRKRQHYHMRERLLIQNTMVKAEMMLSNQSSKLSGCKVALTDPFDDIKTPPWAGQARYYPPPPPLSLSNSEQSVLSSLSSRPAEPPSSPSGTLTETSHHPCPTSPVSLPVPIVNTAIQKSSSSASIIPFHFLHSIINYLRSPFFELWRLSPFISWSAFFFTKRDRGTCLHSAGISIAATFTQK